jgi:hypothetical protein
VVEEAGVHDKRTASCLMDSILGTEGVPGGVGKLKSPRNTSTTLCTAHLHSSTSLSVLQPKVRSLSGVMSVDLFKKIFCRVNVVSLGSDDVANTVSGDNTT